MDPASPERSRSCARIAADQANFRNSLRLALSSSPPIHQTKPIGILQRSNPIHF
jgi:hypothetical protein